MTSELENTLSWQMVAAGIETSVDQHAFDKPRRWRFDFAWPERLVAVEVEGGSWVGGAHNRGAHFELDCEKYNRAAVLGWRVLRVTGAMVKDGRALQTIEAILR